MRYCKTGITREWLVVRGPRGFKLCEGCCRTAKSCFVGLLWRHPWHRARGGRSSTFCLPADKRAGGNALCRQREPPSSGEGRSETDKLRLTARAEAAAWIPRAWRRQNVSGWERERLRGAGGLIGREKTSASEPGGQRSESSPRRPAAGAG